MNYVTLTTVKQVLGLQDETKDDALLQQFIEWSTAQINTYKDRFYEPRIETRLYDYPNLQGSRFGVFDASLLPARSQSPLRLDADLLEVVELLNGDEVEITTDYYVLEPSSLWPKTRVRLIDGASWNPASNGRTEQVIALNAIWGAHDNYRSAWLTSRQSVQDDPLTNSATTITVTNSSIFQVGQLLRLGTEFALVTAITVTPGVNPAPDTHELTVSRAENGSSAAQHDKNTPIYIYQVPGNIAQAAQRLVKWRYTQKDVDSFDRTFQLEAGQLTVPTSLPADVVTLLGARKVRL